MLLILFFSILNFREVESMWNKEEVLKNQYIEENEFNDDLSNLPYGYDVLNCYEPYYCFYFWLRRKNKKTLFINSTMCSDSISNLVSHKNEEFLCHTWYARSYGINDKHSRELTVF